MCQRRSTGELARKIIGGIAFGLFTALEDQLPLTKFMQNQGRIPRSYATPWSCSYSKPDCGLRGLMEQWDTLYQTSLVPSADGEFSTIRSVDIGPLNNGISYTCADDPPEVQFLRLIEDIGSVVDKIESATPHVSIVIADYPTVDESQLQALVDAGVTQLENNIRLLCVAQQLSAAGLRTCSSASAGSGSLPLGVQRQKRDSGHVQGVPAGGATQRTRIHRDSSRGRVYGAVRDRHRGSARNDRKELGKSRDEYLQVALVGLNAAAVPPIAGVEPKRALAKTIVPAPP